jgi:hypothetical protein
MKGKLGFKEDKVVTIKDAFLWSWKTKIYKKLATWNISFHKICDS